MIKISLSRLLLFFGLIACDANIAKAEWDYYAIDYDNANHWNRIYQVDSSNGQSNLVSTKQFPGLNPNDWDRDRSYIDKDDGSLHIVTRTDKVFRLDPSSLSWSDVTDSEWSLSYDKHFERQVIVENSDGSILVGNSSINVQITSEGISDATGANLIKRTADGALHIGENSLVTKEQDGRQGMWATDANGGSIDIDVTNGSRLLINGRDVEKSIDNVGALSAALGSVPAISADSQFTCGFGAGTHSSAYALSGGCASRVSDRVSVNAALATVINNHTGDSDDNLSARAGFTFRLGKIDDSPKIAARKAAELHDKVGKLEESNQALAATNQSLMKLLQAQSARLDNLEKIASGQLSLLGDRASSD